MPPKKPVATKVAAKPAAKSNVTKAPAKKPAAKAAPGVVKKGSGTKVAAAKPKPEVPKWTPQDEAARTIQCAIRQFLARCRLRRRKKEKEDYEFLMDKLEKEAFVHLVKLQQEEAAREMEKEEAERRKKREEAKRRKRMLEAAFDGDIDEMKTILKEVEALYEDDEISRALRTKHIYNTVECEDANSNTPVSEAAAGGMVQSVKFLLDRGANPNTKGHFGRTPLYRAGFAGHLEATQLLLQYGADPRLYADDGQTPAQIASGEPIVELLSTWDVTQTEKLLEKLEKEVEKRKEEDNKRRAAETNKLEDQIAEAEKDFKIEQKKLMKATEELNARITEHDTGVVMGFERPEVTVQMIHDSETDVEVARIHYDKARDKLSALKLKLRDTQLEGKEGSGGPDSEVPGLKVLVKELDEVLIRDVGDRIHNSGKWPLIIDATGQATTFIRYRDNNCINALNPREMEPDRIRIAVLGSIRFGKPLVLDMMQVDMFDAATTRFNEVMPGLMQHIMDKSIMEERVYEKLIRESDGPEYSKKKFMLQFTSKFRFWIITKNPFPPEELLAQTYPIRMHMPT